EKDTGPIGRAKHTQVWRTANWHMTVMLTVTVLVIVETIARVTAFDTTTSTGLPLLVLSIVVGALVALGAAYGGALVFDYQFNVVPLKGSTVWDEIEDDQLPGQRK